MKAKHRHELKTNELAEWIAGLPEWAKENLTMIIIVSAAVVLAVGSLFYFKYQKNVVSVRERTNLTQLIGRLAEAKGRILRAHASGTDISYILLQLANELQTFAQNAKNDRLSAVAFIKRAEALRAELHYRPATVTSADIQEQLRAAKESYNKALARITKTNEPTSATPDSSEETVQSESNKPLISVPSQESWQYPLLVATAKFGLGLCEEEIGNFEQASKIYQEIYANPAFEATVAAASARDRLDIMNEYKEKVVFRTAPPPSQTPPAAPAIPLTGPASGAVESTPSTSGAETEADVSVFRPETVEEPQAAVLPNVNNSGESGIAETNKAELP